MSRPASRLGSLGQLGYAGGFGAKRVIPFNVNGTALLQDPDDPLYASDLVATNPGNWPELGRSGTPTPARTQRASSRGSSRVSFEGIGDPFVEPEAQKWLTEEDVRREVAAIHERIEADEGKAARPTLNAHQDKIEGLEGRIARLEDDIFQRATPSYLGKSTAGENRGPVVRRAGFDQPDPKAAIQERAAERERERERRRAKLPSTSVVGRRPFKAYYAPEPSTLRPGSGANYGVLSSKGDQIDEKSIRIVRDRPPSRMDNDP